MLDLRVVDPWISRFNQVSCFPRLDMTGRHRVVVERLRIEVQHRCLLLVDPGSIGERSHVIALVVSWITSSTRCNGSNLRRIRQSVGKVSLPIAVQS